MLKEIFCTKLKYANIKYNFIPISIFGVRHKTLHAILSVLQLSITNSHFELNVHNTETSLLKLIQDLGSIFIFEGRENVTQNSLAEFYRPKMVVNLEKTEQRKRFSCFCLFCRYQISCFDVCLKQYQPSEVSLFECFLLHSENIWQQC